MKGLKQKLALLVFFVAGAIIGFFKGHEAKQKWVFKLKDKHDNRRQMAQRKTIAKQGGVLLDDIEMAAYHK